MNTCRTGGFRGQCLLEISPWNGIPGRKEDSSPVHLPGGRLLEFRAGLCSLCCCRIPLKPALDGLGDYMRLVGG